MGDGPDGDKGKGEKGDGDAKPPEPPTFLPLPKSLLDFLECKTDSVTLGADLDTGVKGVTAGFGAAKDEKKKRHFTITLKGLNTKMALNVPDPLALDASVGKDGELHIHVRDDKSLPDDIKNGIKKYVQGVNGYLKKKGKKLGAPEIKDGKLVLTKEASTAMLRSAGSGFFAHIPRWEKAVGVGTMVVATAFGVGFMNSGDSEERVTLNVPAPVDDGGDGATEPVPPVTVDEPFVISGAVGAAHSRQEFSDLFIDQETGQPFDGNSAYTYCGTVTNVPVNGLLSFTVEGPNGEFALKARVAEFGRFRATGGIFKYGDYRLTTGSYWESPSVQHPLDFSQNAEALEMYNVNGDEAPCDPAEQPEAPVVDRPAAPTPAEEPTKKAVTKIERTDGKPWSLLAIPGTAAMLLGLGYGEEMRRRREEDEEPVARGVETKF